MYILRIINPKTTPKMVNIMLYKPSALKESLSKIVEIMKPVFLINCEYLSVYWKEISKIKTSTKIKIVKKSIKKTPLRFSV